MKHKIPKANVMIGRNDNTEDLYTYEDRVRESIRLAALELGRVLGNASDTTTYYHVTLPAALLQMLDTFERNASDAAAIALLRSRGYTVEIPADKASEFEEVD